MTVNQGTRKAVENSGIERYCSSGVGSRKSRRVRPAFEIGAHVGAQRAVIVADANPGPLVDGRPLFAIAVDRHIQELAIRIALPAAAFSQPLHSRAREADVGGEEAATRAQDARHLGYRLAVVLDVDEGDVTDGEVERLGPERQRLADGAGGRDGAALHGGAQEEGRRVDAGAVGAAFRELSAEAAFAAADVEHARAGDVAGKAQHDRIEQGAREILVDCGDPRFGGCGPAAVGAYGRL